MIAAARAARPDSRRVGTGGLDAARDLLVEGSRARLLAGLAPRESLASLATGGLFLAVAVPLALFTLPPHAPSLVIAALFVAAYGLAAQVEFEVGAGVAVPTELVFVPMLFVLPPGLAPILVMAGILTGGTIRHLRRRTPVARTLLTVGNAWYAVGPVCVLLADGSHAASLSRWPVYVAALAAQFVFDLASASAREWLALGVAPKLHVRYTAWVCGADAALAPCGLLASLTSARSPLAFALLLPLVGLLAVFARQRRGGIDSALELGQAYRGTALLLGDVIEADDSYTGGHSRDVVELVLAVADELGLDANQRRDVEFAALLHDVGKIRIPNEIINKRGPLSPEEWDLVKQHTLEGERMLAQVGGLLGEVGSIVRSSHERWDGLGYPDGFTGDEIPLAARIVSCCDAFSAITTDRSYRAARSTAAAIAELEREAGSHHDPRVVVALARVVAATRTAPDTMTIHSARMVEAVAPTVARALA